MKIYQFKTGDIILFKKKYRDRAIWLMLTNYTHIGIVINLNNKLYILENNPPILLKYNNKILKNTTLTELYDRLYNYDDKIYYVKVKLNYQLKIEENLKKNLKKYLSIKFPKNKLLYLFYTLIIKNEYSIPKYLICSELIYYILFDTKLVKSYLCKTPDDIIKCKFYSFKGKINKKDLMFIKYIT